MPHAAMISRRALGKNQMEVELRRFRSSFVGRAAICATIPATRTTLTWSTATGKSSAASFGRSAMRAGSGICTLSSGGPCGTPAPLRRATRRRRHSGRRGKPCIESQDRLGGCDKKTASW